MKIGIMLSGGGSKGVAHIGVLRALREAGIRPHAIAGVSAGSIVAAMYGAGMSTETMVEEVRKALKTNLLDPNLRWGSQALLGVTGGLLPVAFLYKAGAVKLPLALFHGNRIEKRLQEVFHNVTFDQLPVPTAVAATDLRTGKLVVFTRSDLVPENLGSDRLYAGGHAVHKAIRASISVPGVFDPVPLEPYLLVDGGVRNNIPADVLRRLGADFVIAVNVSWKGGYPQEVNGLVDIFLRSVDIMGQEVADLTTHSYADVVIHPQVSAKGLFDISHLESNIEEGYREAKKKIPEILAKIKG